MSATEQVQVKRHDVIEVSARRVGEVARTGEILEVLGSPGHPHFRIRWDDDHESLFYPGSDTSVGIRRSADPRVAPEPSVSEVVELLRKSDVEFELLPHRRTKSATSEARAVGVLPQETGKTVVVRIDGGCLRAVVPASSRLDLEKLGSLLGSDPVLLTEAELDGCYPQFELGAVPPFGGPEDRVVVDGRLAECAHVVIEAGTHDTSVRMSGRDLVDVAKAQVGDISTT